MRRKFNLLLVFRKIKEPCVAQSVSGLKQRNEPGVSRQLGGCEFKSSLCRLSALPYIGMTVSNLQTVLGFPGLCLFLSHHNDGDGCISEIFLNTALKHQSSKDISK